MKKVMYFAAAAAAATLIATPVLAQDSMKPATVHHMHAHPVHHAHMYRHGVAYRHAYRNDWPGAAVGTAGAVAATAVGTAAAVAAAPFGGGPYYNSYAYSPGYTTGYDYSGTALPWSPDYAARNGFMCQPGTLTRPANGNGVAVVCQ